MAYVPSSEQEKKFLESYDASKYQNPAVAADVALFAIDGGELKLLLIKRGGYPYKDCWALPGGFVDIDEDVSTAAKRELLEEAGIEGVFLEQAFVWGKADRDPRNRVITVSYIALAEYSKLFAKAGDDASQAEWFAIADYEKTIEGDSTHISYTLVGPETISAQVSFPTDRIQEIACEKSGGLAFDHAESILYSVELMKRRVSDIAEISLGESQRKNAINVIENT